MGCLICAHGNPEGMAIRREVHAAAYLRLCKVDMVVDHEIDCANDDRCSETNNAKGAGEQGNSQRAERVQAGVNNATGMTIGAFVANLPVALKNKVEQEMLGLQAEQYRQSSDG